jgi:hypothetical protein
VSIPARFSCLLLLAGLLAVTTGCHHAARQSEVPVSILISGPVELGRLPRAAALVAARRERAATGWLVAGQFDVDTLTALVTEGRGALRALAAAGADGLVFRPELLAAGVEAARRNVGSSTLHLLSCNLADSLGEPLGHPMLILRLGETRVGLTAAWTDSADARLRQQDVMLLPADRAAARTLGLLRMRCDVVGGVFEPEAAPGTGFDFTIGPAGSDRTSASIPVDPDRPVRLDLYLRDGRVVDSRQVEERLADWPEDEAVRRVVDSVEAAVASVLAAPVAGSTVEARPEALGRMFVAGRLRRDIDGFLTDRPLFLAPLGPGDIDARAVVAAMEEPGRLGIFELTGWQIKELTEDRGVDLQWRTALRHVRTAMTRRYRLAATPGFLARHPLAATNGYEHDDEPAWRIAARLLAEGRR